MIKSHKILTLFYPFDKKGMIQEFFVFLSLRRIKIDFDDKNTPWSELLSSKNHLFKSGVKLITAGKRALSCVLKD